MRCDPWTNKNQKRDRQKDRHDLTPKFPNKTKKDSGLTRGRSAQDPPCPRAHVRSKKKSGICFRQNFPWEASPEALLEVISDENIGRTDKLSRSS